MAAKAATFASGFRYRDRYGGRPIHDEQGSYDRPHDLTVDFDPVKIDALLKSLGREPWLSHRPRIVVFLNVRPPRKGPAFTLVGDSNGEREADMRASLAAAAERVGLPMALPLQAELTRANQRAAGAALKGGTGSRSLETWSGAMKRSAGLSTGGWTLKAGPTNGRSGASVSTTHSETACAAQHKFCPATAGRTSSFLEPSTSVNTNSPPTPAALGAPTQSLVFGKG